MESYDKSQISSIRYLVSLNKVPRHRNKRKEVLNKNIIPENHASELYFEEPDIEAFARKLEKLYPDIRYVNRLMTYSWGQQVVRFYDPDGNLIEVRTPM